MRFRVYLLRHRGRRTKRDGDGVVGNMLMSSTLRGNTNIEQMSLTELDVRGSRSIDVVLPLFEPVLVAMGGTGFLLRGYEFAEGTAYVQEWRCEPITSD